MGIRSLLTGLVKTRKSENSLPPEWHLPDEDRIDPRYGTYRPTQDDLKSGNVMLDNTVFVDVSPRTQEPMFTTRRDVEVRIEDAEKYIRQLNERNAYGHNDWRLGDKKEIDVLLANRTKGALSGTFNSRRFVVSPFYDETFPPVYLSTEDLTDDAPHFRLNGERYGVQAKVCKGGATVTIRPVRSGPI